MTRMRLFVRGLLHQAKKHKVECELIMVEWNPPADTLPLKDVLPGSEGNEYLDIRYIVVPHELHSRYKVGERMPLFQMIGKNVGIRRAKGQFVLCTNVDLLFSDGLFSILADGGLNKEAYYRANRCDIPAKVEEDWPMEKVFQYAEANIIRRLGKDERFLYLPQDQNVGTVITRWLNNTAAAFYVRKRPWEVRWMQLDTYACGDFTMMTKEAWIDIQGYLELDLYSIHIDSFGILAAASLGYRQVVLPPDACTYHIDHYSGWESMTPLEKISFWNKKPGLGYDLLWDTARTVLSEPQKFNINPENWGFADIELEEYIC